MDADLFVDIMGGGRQGQGQGQRILHIFYSCLPISRESTFLHLKKEGLEFCLSGWRTIYLTG